MACGIGYSLDHILVVLIFNPFVFFCYCEECCYCKVSFSRTDLSAEQEIALRVVCVGLAEVFCFFLLFALGVVVFKAFAFAVFRQIGLSDVSFYVSLNLALTRYPVFISVLIFSDKSAPVFAFLALIDWRRGGNTGRIVFDFLDYCFEDFRCCLNFRLLLNFCCHNSPPRFS